VTSTDSVDESVGNPPPSEALKFDAPATGTEEHVVVAYPIGDEFIYDPIEFGPAMSLDFALDVLAERVTGASHVDITLAVLQGEFFIASPNPSTPSVDGTDGAWTGISHSGLEARDFLAVDGSGAVPDFSQPFQFAYAFHANYSSAALSVDLRLDNMQATVNTIPEPTSLGLAMSMGAALLWHRWWYGQDR
jgi:hypothetical protein